MVRKKRNDGPSEAGEGSGTREAAPVSGGGGRGSQRGGFQQGGGGGGGGYQQGGRGYNPQSQQGGRGGGGGRAYGQPPQQQQQQQYGGPQEYQGRGRGRGGPPHEGGRGGYGGGRGGGPSAGPPQRQSVPELHQATSPTIQAMSSQPTPTEVSPTQMPEPSVPVKQFEQLSLEQGASSQAIQPLPQSSKAYRFPMRPGRGQTGQRCIVKANHFFAELPDKDLHQYDVSFDSLIPLVCYFRYTTSNVCFWVLQVTITPEVTSRGVNRAVMKQLVDLYRDSHLGRRLPAYDGRKSLYTAGPLPFISKEFRITLLDEEEGAGGQRSVFNFCSSSLFSSKKPWE